MNLHIVVNASATNDTDLSVLRLKIADHLKELFDKMSNSSLPGFDGIVTLNSVKISKER